MTIDQITDTVRDRQARRHIREQYAVELRIFGEREALEFARFRANVVATDEEQQNHLRYLKFLGWVAAYAATFGGIIGFTIGRAI